MAQQIQQGQSTAPAVDAIGLAFHRMTNVLFKPFDITKWIVLAFALFMASLTRQGLQAPRIAVKLGRQDKDWVELVRQSPAEIAQWMETHGAWFLVLIAAGVIAAMAVWLVATWLASYGTFIFTANVARNRRDFGRLWSEFSTSAVRLFLWRTGLTATFWAFAAVIVGAGGILIRLREPSRLLTGGAVAALALVLLVAMAVYLLLMALLTDFVVPLMIRFDLGVWKAGNFLRKLIVARTVHFIVYFLFKILFGSIIGVAAFVVIFATCCIGALPVVHQFILLPAAVAIRAYSLTFLELIHPDLALMNDQPQTPSPESAEDVQAQ